MIKNVIFNEVVIMKHHVIDCLSKLSKPLFFILLFSSCHQQSKEQVDPDIWIDTHYGVMGLSLYDETPQHKQAILNLTKEGHYEHCSIEQILNDALIDIAISDSILDTFSTKDRFVKKQEIIDDMPVKKGALVAHRPDPLSNPLLNSDLTRYYLIIGTTMTDYEIDVKQTQIGKSLLELFIVNYLNRPENVWINEFALKLDSIPISQRDSVMELLSGIRASALREWTSVHSPLIYSRSARKSYKEVGGIPEMERQYTVVGEVVVGIDVIDSINQNLTYLNFDHDSLKSVSINISL